MDEDQLFQQALLKCAERYLDSKEHFSLMMDFIVEGMSGNRFLSEMEEVRRELGYQAGANLADPEYGADFDDREPPPAA